MIKFIVELEPEFDETPEELQELLEECLRDINMFGIVKHEV